MSAKPLRVVIADDQELVRAGFRMILNAQDGIEVVGEAGDGVVAIATWRRERPDLILMDIRMPELDGLEAARQILRAGDGCRVVMLTTFDLDEYIYAALSAGASGFLLKDISPEQLGMAVRMVAAGEALLAPSITRRLIARFASGSTAPIADHQRLRSLTPREREVFQLVARGLSNVEIADQLVIGEATVKTHVARMLEKLGLRDRVQAVILAYETGVVQPGTDSG